MKKYPKEIYVEWNDDHDKTEPPYLLADETIDGMAPNPGEKKVIAVYRLVETREVTVEVKQNRRR